MRPRPQLPVGPWLVVGLARSGIAAALAGASGNLADRVIHGAVVDFVALGRWPVFNLADVAIVAGAVVAGASLIPIARGW